MGGPAPDRHEKGGTALGGRDGHCRRGRDCGWTGPSSCRPCTRRTARGGRTPARLTCGQPGPGDARTGRPTVAARAAARGLPQPGRPAARAYGHLPRYDVSRLGRRHGQAAVAAAGIPACGSSTRPSVPTAGCSSTPATTRSPASGTPPRAGRRRCCWSTAAGVLDAVFSPDGRRRLTAIPAIRPGFGTQAPDSPSVRC